MRGVCVFLLTALPLCASVLEVGPISLTGSGTLTDPDCAPYGGECLGGLGLVINASGTNGIDTVSINSRDVELTANIDGQDFYLTNMSFDEGVNQCFLDFSYVVDLCGVTIDGITGIGAFHLGGPNGLVQVYSPTTLALLAEAQIVNTEIQLTSVTYGPGHVYCPTCPPGDGSFTATFAVVDPQADAPEPGTVTLGLIGLAALCHLRRHQNAHRVRIRDGPQILPLAANWVTSDKVFRGGICRSWTGHQRFARRLERRR